MTTSGFEKTMGEALSTRVVPLNRGLGAYSRQATVFYWWREGFEPSTGVGFGGLMPGKDLSIVII